MKTNKRWILAIAILSLAFIALAAEQVKKSRIPTLKTPDFSKLTALDVVRVVDGDTIVVGKDIKVRLIGVDTPETVHPFKPVEHYGKEASRFTSNLLKGEKVYLVSDPQGDKADRYGRTLAHVYRAPDGLFVNAEIIRQGYGHAYTRFPFMYMEEFKQLERFAREAEKGLWGAAVVDPPNATTQPVSGSAMVYVTRTGKKYHKGDCSYLSKSKIQMKLSEAKGKYGACGKCKPRQ
jgi:micrococcal nuclease